MWTLGEAVALCRLISIIAPDYGCHVALTGGVLYKFGPRKDLDLLFYRIRQVEKVDVDGLFDALASIGIVRVVREARWCVKGTHEGRPIDCFFPDLSGDYPANPAGPASERDDIDF
jgi:hypothetical protein